MTDSTENISLRQASNRAAGRIVVTYVVFAGLWIMLSDKALVLIFDDPEHLVRASIIKGWAFVLVTAGLLYVLVARLVHRIKASAKRDRQNRQRKAAEFRAHSERVHAQLERRVEARTAELRAANQELDAFAYAVSHDLRAPLRAMSGFSEALIEDYGDGLNDEAQQYLRQITLASRKMNELIEGILVLSRCTRGELELQSIDLSEMANQHISRLRREHPGRQVEVIIEPELAVTADPRTFEAALANLLDNAWKYTGNTANARVTVSASKLEGQPAICIEDNGAGFDMAHADKLFKPFQRLHRQEEFAGTGIGLATVYRIIQRHHGKIKASAQPGKGARFRFSLPPASLPKEHQ